ncbi:hypothetical protein Q5M85_07300 [Paraclostridium bifermentans]|nr:hypothetical protein [Paraclostridium bifermentans]
MLQVVLDRKHLHNFQNTINSYDSRAFVEYLKSRTSEVDILVEMR